MTKNLIRRLQAEEVSDIAAKVALRKGSYNGIWRTGTYHFKDGGLTVTMVTYTDVNQKTKSIRVNLGKRLVFHREICQPRRLGREGIKTYIPGNWQEILKNLCKGL